MCIMIRVTDKEGDNFIVPKDEVCLKETSRVIAIVDSPEKGIEKREKKYWIFLNTPNNNLWEVTETEYNRIVQLLEKKGEVI